MRATLYLRNTKSFMCGDFAVQSPDNNGLLKYEIPEKGDLPAGLPGNGLVLDLAEKTYVLVVMW